MFSPLVEDTGLQLVSGGLRRNQCLSRPDRHVKLSERLGSRRAMDHTVLSIELISHHLELSCKTAHQFGLGCNINKLY